MACPVKKIIDLPDGDHQMKVWIIPTWTQLQHQMRDVRKREPHVVIPYALIQIINSYNLFYWLRKKTNPRPKYHQEKEYSSRPSNIGYSLINCTNSFHTQFFFYQPNHNLTNLGTCIWKYESENILKRKNFVSYQWGHKLGHIKIWIAYYILNISCFQLEIPLCAKKKRTLSALW